MWATGETALRVLRALRVGDFTAAVAQGDFALVAVIGNETPQIAHFNLIVAFVGARTEFDLLDLDHLLLGFGFSSALLLLVTELAVVHEAAHRGICRGSDLDQIDVEFACHAQGFHGAHDAQGFVFNPVQTDFRGCDLPIESVFALYVGSTAVSKSSDG